MEPVLFGAIAAVVSGVLTYAAAIMGIRRAKEADRGAMVIAVRAENREELEGVIDAMGKLIDKLEAQIERKGAEIAEGQVDIRELRVERAELRSLLVECRSECRSAQAELKRITGRD